MQNDYSAQVMRVARVNGEVKVVETMSREQHAMKDYLPRMSEPFKTEVPYGTLSTIHNGRYWETIFFSNGELPSLGDRKLVFLNGVEEADTFARFLNISPIDVVLPVLKSFKRADGRED